MDKTVRRICGMLQSPDGMRRCAAAMVLNELAPRDAAIIKALGEALKNANQLLTRYVLEAFDTLGSHAAVPYVLPLLDAEDMETKLRAAAIVARAGTECLPELKRQFDKASPQQKRVLVDILARIHSRDAMQLILNVLFDTDFELVKEACQAVRRHIGDAAPHQSPDERPVQGRRGEKPAQHQDGGSRRPVGQDRLDPGKRTVWEGHPGTSSSDGVASGAGAGIAS